mmetsp:Transcript_20656/g.43426  ORF Transcript_20656/g.43426 Transcript_20656/m.43426 type:complete len:83 (-) Transcript_20656:981-1229(-)
MVYEPASANNCQAEHPCQLQQHSSQMADASNGWETPNLASAVQQIPQCLTLRHFASPAALLVTEFDDQNVDTQKSSSESSSE